MSEVTAEVVEETPVLSVIEALSAAMNDAGAVGKGNQNKQQGWLFRGVDAVVNAASPAFKRHGIVVVPSLVSVDRETASTRNGGTVQNVYVVVDYKFYGPAGDSVTARVAAQGFDAGDKATAKAMSVAFRTALLQTLSLPTDDPDPDEFTYERSNNNVAPFVPITLEGLDAVKQWIDYLGWDAEKVKKATAYASHNRVVEVEQMSDAEGVTFCQFAETKDPQGGTQEALPVKGTR